ncbi:MAG: hypothetical protein NC314_02630 [Roseburia sp.]|nr:hypothetical protein [Roseburia sp.]MCM1241711.1 hypothetical protein [Roseburia sp.]
MKYANEGMDCKKYMLLFLQKAWIAVLAALAGALLGGGIYLLVNVVPAANREYRAESKLYLDFAIDESGEVYQAYNGYTWNDLMSTEPILDTTMSYLPDSYTKEEVTTATSAQILSDIRLLTITITTPEAERTAEILKATDLSLVDLGKQAKEFVDIEIYKETAPKVVAVGERFWQAVMLGAVLALILALLAMALIYVLEDKIYVPGDLKCVTDIPFAGYCFTEEVNAVAAALQNDTRQNLAHINKETGAFVKLEVERGREIVEECAVESGGAVAILLVVPYGKMDRTTLQYRIEQLTLRGGRIVGILIRDADMRFMRWYYNHL